MNSSQAVECNRDLQLENLAADLADVAYQMALRHGASQRWLELEVDLWGAMTEAIEKRACIESTQNAAR